MSVSQNFSLRWTARPSNLSSLCLSVSPGCVRPCLFCNRLLSGSRCPDSVSPLRPPWNRRTDRQTYRPNTVMRGQAARNTKGSFCAELVGGAEKHHVPHAGKHEGRGKKKEREKVLGKQQHGYVVNLERRLSKATKEPSARVSPRVERQAVCVGAVRPRVVGGGNGVPQQPHPGPDVHVHLTGAQKCLAWVSATHSDACLVAIRFPLNHKTRDSLFETHKTRDSQTQHHFI